jgi:hypothetical protein
MVLLGVVYVVEDSLVLKARIKCLDCDDSVKVLLDVLVDIRDVLVLIEKRVK